MIRGSLPIRRTERSQNPSSISKCRSYGKHPDGSCRGQRRNGSDRGSREPEIEILCGFLRAMGVRVEGEGTSVIKIRGTSTFEDTSFFIPGDRIVAGTYLGAVLCAGGRVFLEQAPAGHMERTIETARQMGATVESLEEGIRVSMRGLPHRSVLRPDLTRSSPQICSL